MATESSGADVNSFAQGGAIVDGRSWRIDAAAVGMVVLILLGGALALDPALALVASLGFAVFVAGIASTSLAVGCVLLSVPVQDAGSVTLGGTELTFTKVAAAAAVLVWTYKVLADPSLMRIDATAALYVALMAALVISIVSARSLEAWAGEVYRWGIALVVYVMATTALRERWFPVVLLGSSAAGVVAVTIVGMWQALTGAGPPSFESRGVTRAYAAFGEPNPLAGYLEMTVPILIAIALSGRRNWLTERGKSGNYLWFVSIGAAGCGVVALLLTQSRGGMLGMAAGVVVVLLLTDGWPRWIAVGGIILAMALLAATPLGSRVTAAAFGASGDQQVTPRTFAVQERLAHWRTGMSMVRAHPVLGVGAGNYSERYREFAEVWRFRISRGHAHNTYIQMTAQAGLVGLGSYIGLLGVVVWRLGRAFNSLAGHGSRALIAGALGVMVAVFVHGMFDYLHVLSLGLQFSAVWALANLGAGGWSESDR